MTELMGRLADWVIEAIHTLGYLGVGVFVALENLVPPIPSELILPLAGFLAGQGRFSLPLVVAVATLGSTLGALVLYGLGRWLGEDRLRRFVAGPGRFLLLRERDLDQAAAWFQRHGGLAVFIGRLAPLVRSGISVPAGVERMPVWRFTIYTALGSGIWNGALVGLGWALGSQWPRVSQYAQWLSYTVLALLAAAIGWFVWRRRRQQRRQSSP